MCARSVLPLQFSLGTVKVEWRRARGGEGITKERRKLRNWPIIAEEVQFQAGRKKLKRH